MEIDNNFAQINFITLPKNFGGQMKFDPQHKIMGYGIQK